MISFAETLGLEEGRGSQSDSDGISKALHLVRAWGDLRLVNFPSAMVNCSSEDGELCKRPQTVSSH